MVVRPARPLIPLVLVLAVAAACNSCSSGGSSAKPVSTTVPASSLAVSPQERTAITHDVPAPAGYRWTTIWLANSAPNWGAGAVHSKKATQFVFVRIPVPGVTWAQLAIGTSPRAGCAKVPPDVLKELFPALDCNASAPATSTTSKR